MKIKHTKTLLVSTLASVILGSIFGMAPLVHAQVPLVPGVTTSPTKSPPTTITSNVTTPTKLIPKPPISRIVGVNFTNATGTISSLQNNQISKPHGTWFEQFMKNGIWLLSGKWTLGLPSLATQMKIVTTPTFDASFSMVMINGSAMHKHKISNFQMIGNPVTNRTEKSIMFMGNATVTLKDGPHKNVPIAITLIDKSVIRIGIDQTKTNGHFGATPIFGSISKLS